MQEFATIFTVKPQLRLRIQRYRTRGQMAIFIALIFQVLFVFFAMAINVALVVHDKINLQNAVDLAAYYAASKQAEMLNVIAHENYMIRQSWKLLAWRYRVLGAAGNRNPIHPWQGNYLTEGGPYIPGPPDKTMPAVCVVYADMWKGVEVSQSLCKEPAAVIPALPRVRPPAMFLGFNVVFSRLADRLIEQFDANCDSFGAYNWWYGAAILQAFREDQRNRKLMIYALGNSLGRDRDFLDLDGNSVEQGAYATYSKNLSYSNFQAQAGFQIYNSLQGKRAQDWLKEIVISPTVFYNDPRGSSGCYAEWKPVTADPDRLAARTLISSPRPAGFGASDLIAWSRAEILPEGEPYNYSMGVEKSPWIMAYVGAKAETQPRQIFFPFGGGVRITARAFAKPFGGRIGPWFGSSWPQSSPQSLGTQTDPWAPPRRQANGLMDMDGHPNRYPNYSRFPGDNYGLTSVLALNGIKGYGGRDVEYWHLQHIWLPMANGGYNDPLAFDTFANQIVPQRVREIAAISPDLFDTTYYSIEPNFATHYLAKLVRSRTQLGIPDNLPIRGDLGQNAALNNLGFSVQDQIAIAQGVGQPAPVQRSEAFYFLRNKKDLLTSWATGENVFQYGFPADRFGKCGSPDDGVNDRFKVPGSCLALGGRTGYSVKLISKDYLAPSTSHPIGGGSESGPIQNPPPADW